MRRNVSHARQLCGLSKSPDHVRIDEKHTGDLTRKFLNIVDAAGLVTLYHHFVDLEMSTTIRELTEWAALDFTLGLTIMERGVRSILSVLVEHVRTLRRVQLMGYPRRSCGRRKAPVQRDGPNRDSPICIRLKRAS